MDYADLKDRYRSLPTRKRLLFIVVLGILPAIYIYLEDGQTLAEQLEQSKQEQDAAQAKLDRSLAKKKQIPQLEMRLSELEDQLVKARKALPDSYKVEEILQRTASIAKETGVKLLLFKPGQEKQGVGDYQYMEMPIATEISGKFNQIAAFLDRLAHLKNSLFVRSIIINKLNPNLDRESDSSSMHQRAVDARERIVVSTNLELVIFRSLSEQESASQDLQENSSEKNPQDPEQGKSPADSAENSIKNLLKKSSVAALEPKGGGG